jgi:hypothetical protein
MIISLPLAPYLASRILLPGCAFTKTLSRHGRHPRRSKGCPLRLGRSDDSIHVHLLYAHLRLGSNKRFLECLEEASVANAAGHFRAHGRPHTELSLQAATILPGADH